MTETKRLAEELRRTREELDALRSEARAAEAARGGFEAAFAFRPLMMVLFDREMRFLRVSAAWSALTGLGEAEVVGQAGAHPGDQPVLGLAHQAPPVLAAREEHALLAVLRHLPPPRPGSRSLRPWHPPPRDRLPGWRPAGAPSDRAARPRPPPPR